MIYRGRSCAGVALGVVLILGTAGGGSRAGIARAPDEFAGESGCARRAANHRLDFWLGDWIVYVGSGLDGTNHIVSILGGCAVQEDWTDISGSQGRSWFFVDPTTGRMKQIWLTSHAEQVGGTKEKAELPGEKPDFVQFQGVLVSESGKRIIDRTTLTLQPAGTVRQVIESSKDDGRSWTVDYDATYRRSALR